MKESTDEQDERRMRSLSIGLILLVLLLHARGEEPTGSVCVASRADTPFRNQVIPQTGEVSSGGLRVKIDKRAPVAWPQRKGLKFDGLDLHERHLLAVVDANGKPVESLWFKFSSYESTDLCMSYDGYQGVNLQEIKQSPWCKCK